MPIKFTEFNEGHGYKVNNTLSYVPKHAEQRLHLEHQRQKADDPKEVPIFFFELIRHLGKTIY